MTLKEFQQKVFPLKNKLFRFSFSFLKNSEDAADVVQEVMLKIWDKRAEMTHVQNWEAWSMRMTRNMSLDKLKSKTRQWSELGDLPLESSGKSPHEISERNDAVSMAKSAMSQLPEKQQRIIHLRDMLGYSYKEIAEVLEMDINQVKVYLFRARKYVREQLLKKNAYGL